MKIVNRNINLNNYVIFYIVAKLKSFTLASNELFISQPAVSTAIKQLEKTLSVRLFYRDKNNVILTKIGEEVLKYVEIALNNFRIVEDRVLNQQNLEVGDISIGAPAHVHNSHLFNYIKLFLQKFPNISIRLETGNVDKLIEKLQRHEIDFILDEYPLNCKYNNINVINLKKFHKGFIYKKGNYLELDDKEFELNILKKYKLILPLKENAYRKELDNLFYREKISCSNIIEVNNTSQMYKYVDESFGLGYIILELIENKNDYNILKLKDVELIYNLDLMYIDGYTSIMADKLIDFILEMNKNEKN